MRISDWSSDVCSSDLPDVVAVAPFGLAVAAGVATVLIPQDEGCVDGGGDGAGGAPVVEDRRLPVGDDPVQVRVASQRMQRGRVDGGPVEHPPGTAVEEVGQVDDDVEVGPVALAELVRLVVEEETAHIREGLPLLLSEGPHLTVSIRRAGKVRSEEHTSELQSLMRIS